VVCLDESPVVSGYERAWLRVWKGRRQTAQIAIVIVTHISNSPETLNWRPRFGTWRLPENAPTLATLELVKRVTEEVRAGQAPGMEQLKSWIASAGRKAADSEVRVLMDDRQDLEALARQLRDALKADLLGQLAVFLVQERRGRLRALGDLLGTPTSNPADRPLIVCHRLPSPARRELWRAPPRLKRSTSGKVPDGTSAGGE
jgi:hypothetical protein